jgi:hypothetical protein
MIPPLLFVGLTTGALARVKISIVICAAVALAWGLTVGIADGSLITAFAGAGLGAANLATGWTIGRVVTWALGRGE